MGMDQFKSKTESIETKSQTVKDNVEKMFEDFQNEKQAIEGIDTNNLDDSIVDSLESASDAITSEARSDVENLRDTEFSDILQDTESITDDVNQKINDNNSAKSKLEAIPGEYGKSSIDQSISTIESNNDMGNDIIEQLKKVRDDGEGKFNDILSSIN